MLPDPTVSLIIPCYNESENTEALYTRIVSAMQAVDDNWELVLVNDGSTDDTLARLVSLQQHDARLVVVELSRNFGKEAALSAGLDIARGEAIIPLDADLQDPPELIPDLLKKWREGYEVVNAVRLSREGESFFKKLTAHVFYRIINRLSSIAIPEDTGDFRLIARPALEALKTLPERRRFMKGLFAWVGYKTTSISYRRQPRHAGRTKWNYWRLWTFALEGITSFSQAPLQVASYFGFMVSFMAFLYAVFLIVDTLIFGNTVKGYPSLMVAILFLGGIQLMALGILGEYIGRIYEESKQRPVYLVRKIWKGP